MNNRNETNDTAMKDRESQTDVREPSPIWFVWLVQLYLVCRALGIAAFTLGFLFAVCVGGAVGVAFYLGVDPPTAAIGALTALAMYISVNLFVKVSREVLR